MVQENGGRRKKASDYSTRCTYTDFLMCQPIISLGHEGVACAPDQLWDSEKMESVFLISNCAITNQMFPEESAKVERYVGGRPDMIHGSVKASKPQTMQEAIEFATEMMDKKMIQCSLNAKQRTRGSHYRSDCTKAEEWKSKGIGLEMELLSKRYYAVGLAGT
ncbi:hypothetical protein Tco_1132331 [Tanacetum coccineum]|uniref:Fumarate reductase/succinate dehydrogenase flavoprotein-like C-terminal domain-containing protein n=1 Tax=Tanacetum coccineum TaxID=301880 RepID=A0ABQ5JDB0_9ASTR